MQIYEMTEQLTLFDLDSLFGKMCPELFQAESPRARTSASSSRRSSESKTIPFMSLDLSPGALNLLGEYYWEILSPWLGESSTLNTGALPNEEKESSLSQILQADPPQRYYLSKTACLGILRRARERGKELPPQLKRALEIQAQIIEPDGQPTELEAYHINQRDEGIPLGGISGALMATSNMQMQTFVTDSPVGFDGYNGDLTGNKVATLGINGGMSTGRNGIIDGAPIAFAANQREKVNCREAAREATLGCEVRDLHDIAGAIQAQPGMKQQTFVAEGCAMTAGFCAGAAPSAGGIGYREEIAPTLKGSAGGNMMPSILCLNDQGGAQMHCTEDMVGILRAQEHGHQPLVYENHGIDSRYTGPHKVAPTMSARYGTGGNNVPLVSDVAETICIAGNTIDRQPQNGGNGLGCQEDIAYTLTATDHHAVYSRQGFSTFKEGTIIGAECARQHKGNSDLVSTYQEVVGALCSGDEKGIGNQYVGQDKCIVEPRNLIRRLTPLECERLQGFPDGWTDIPSASDSARYKALGNSVAIPCVEFVLRGIAAVLRQSKPSM